MSTDPTDGDAAWPAAWPAAWTAAISDAALLAASSAAVFARGQAYARSGVVADLDEDPMPEPALRARVTGTATYRVEVWTRADTLAGLCDCPHARDGWFCKHQVAVALVWRQRLAGQPTSTPPPSSPAKPDRAPRTALEKRQALHAFLHAQDAATLAEKLLDLAARDRDIDRGLQQWRKLGQLDDDWPGVRRVVSAMLAPGRGFIAWNEGEDYVARASAVLPVLHQAIARDANAAASLAIHALREVWAVVETADDSDGAISDFCGSIGDEFLAALQAAPDQPGSFAEAYLASRLDEPFDAFNARSAEAAMGAVALARYRETLRSRWRAARERRLATPASEPGLVGKPARPAAGSPADEDVASLLQRRVQDTVERLHLEQLVQAGEIDEALAVLRSDLTTGSAHGRVVRFLEEHGRFREAFAAAEASCGQFPDDRYLEDDLLRCYERDGWTEEALALRQRQFERQPSVGTLSSSPRGRRRGRATRRRASGGAFRSAAGSRAAGGGRDSAGRPSACAGATRLRRARALDAGASGARRQSARQHPLQRVELARRVGGGAAAQRLQPSRAAARCSPPSRHPSRGGRAGARAGVRDVMRGSSSPYRVALALVADIASRMPAEERSAWLRALRTEFKTKRNFIGGLPVA